MPAAWPRPTIWRSFARVKCHIWVAPRIGTICAVAPQHWIDGPDEAARSIGLKPLMSGMRTEDEGLFVVQHKYWQEALQRALSAEAAQSL